MLLFVKVTVTSPSPRWGPRSCSMGRRLIINFERQGSASVSCNHGDYHWPCDRVSMSGFTSGWRGQGNYSKASSTWAHAHGRSVYKHYPGILLRERRAGRYVTTRKRIASFPVSRQRRLYYARTVPWTPSQNDCEGLRMRKEERSRELSQNDAFRKQNLVIWKAPR